MRPAKDAIFSYRCSRCDCEFQDYCIISECHACRAASLLMYGGLIQCEMGGE